MNEGQGKPKRWYKKYLSEFDKNLRRLLVIVVFALILAFICVFIINEWNNSPSDNRPATYSTAREVIQSAVAAYGSIHNESLPTLNGTYTNANCSNCSVVNISALLVINGGMLRTYPDGLKLSVSGNDNCGGNASLGCRNGSSYIWIVDTQGTVYSYCTGAGCKTNNSGYQGVWP
jgi:hypothetical protein